MSNAPIPMGLLAELTHRCPLGCPYCSNPVELVRAAGELATATWARVFEEAAALGILQVHLSGGEPCARSDLDELVRHAARAGLYTNLITSAVSLGPDRVARLVEAGLDHVQISFQDVEPEGADRIAGFRGGLDRKIRAARAVREAGLPLTVNAVVHRANLDRLDRMIDLAADLGAERLEVAHVQYHGWALANRAALMPTSEQLDRATDTVEAARERLRGRLVIDYVIPDYYASEPKACMGGWGRQVIVVAPDGRALPCHGAAAIPGLGIQTVMEADLRTLWEENEAFRRFRGTGWMPEPCRSCEHREADWGGCRCQALALTGRADATDPACSRSEHHGRLVALAEAEAGAPAPGFTYRRLSRPVPADA
jgi:PqqA peptide cyclase